MSTRLRVQWWIDFRNVADQGSPYLCTLSKRLDRGDAMATGEYSRVQDAASQQRSSNEPLLRHD